MTDADFRRQFAVRGGTRLADFILSNRIVDVILGPLGSGKTHGMCARIMRHIQEQRPSTRDGLRKSRWAVVRNSYPDLKRSTIRTWTEIVPEHIYGRMNWSLPPSHRLRWDDIQAEIDFLALDKPEDVRKLRSTEYTGIAFNELPFIDKSIFDEAHSRLRYPSKDEGGSEWHGILGDGNAPEEDCWLAVMAGMVDMPPGLSEEEAAALAHWPPDWGLHVQPPALIEQVDAQGRVIGYETNPHAENLENLRADYYDKQIAGKTKSWIDSRLMVRVALVVDGSPVWPNFRAEVHVAPVVLVPDDNYSVEVGLDFGRMPAAVFAQGINNRVLVQHELIGQNEGAVSFAPKVRRAMAAYYPNIPLSRFRFWGDPKGADKTQVDDRTAFEIFANHEMIVRGPPGLFQNKIEPRVEAVDSLLTRMYDGKPCLVVSPRCRTLKVGMAGRYYNEKDEFGILAPDKKRYSHVCEALQYLVMGMGEGRRMTGRKPLGEVKPVRWYKQKSMRRISA
jgi:hypothetical protein